MESERGTARGRDLTHVVRAAPSGQPRGDHRSHDHPHCAGHLPRLPRPRREYRLAAGEVAPAVMAKADRRMQGDPLTPAEEQALLRQGFTWVTRNRSWLLRTREFRQHCGRSLSAGPFTIPVIRSPIVVRGRACAQVAPAPDRPDATTMRTSRGWTSRSRSVMGEPAVRPPEWRALIERTASLDSYILTDRFVIPSMPAVSWRLANSRPAATPAQ